MEPVLIAALSVATISAVLNFVNVQAQQESQNFSATLSGKEEVPPTESNATGTAKFQVNNDTTKISYWINTVGLKRITQAHIHNGIEGQNGDPIVTLTKGKSAEGNATPALIKLSGNITQDNLQGPLKGKGISDLVNLMDNGSGYINAHTDEYPKGVIRGQISAGDVDMQAMWVEEGNNVSSSEN